MASHGSLKEGRIRTSKEVKEGEMLTKSQRLKILLRQEDISEETKLSGKC
jgi:hypothetical protein